MRKFGYVLVALILLNIALFTINQLNEWRDKKSATVSVSESPVSVPVRTEQKTYRINLKVSPVVQSTVKQ